MKPVPIALFVYNRPSHTRRTVEALASNSMARESDLYVFSDGAKNPGHLAAVNEVRDHVSRLDGFKSVNVVTREMNWGLAKSIIDGVTQVCGERGRVIVLEDDLVTSPWFLDFMNRGLTLYERDETVASVHGYCYPIRAADLPETFFLRGADCWGWGTWGRAWEHFEMDGTKLLSELVTRKLEREFDLDGAYEFGRMLREQIAGKNDSWAIRWHASCFLRSMLTLYPARSLVMNIGNDASGTHSLSTEEFDQKTAKFPVNVNRIELKVSETAATACAEFLRSVKNVRGDRRFTARVKRWRLASRISEWLGS